MNMEIVSYIVLGLLIVISPGSDFVLVLKNSINRGRRAGILTGLGIGVGVSIHITYSILGISEILSQNAMLFSLVKYTGAAYLIYLGITGIAASKPLVDLSPTSHYQPIYGGRQHFLQGFFCNVLNPKTMLFFLSVFSQLMSSSHASQLALPMIYGAYIAILHSLWFVAVAFFITSERIRSVLLNVGQRINQVCGMGLIIFGIALSFSG